MLVSETRDSKRLAQVFRPRVIPLLAQDFELED